MDSLKGVFSKGLTTINVKTNNFMEESKCKTYIATLEKEIQDIKTKIGDITYNSWVNETDSNGEIEPLLNSIKEKYALIEEQKQVMANLAVTEQQILGKNQQAGGSATANQQAAQMVYCASCGAQNKAGFKFCCKCGSALS